MSPTESCSACVVVEIVRQLHVLLEGFWRHGQHLHAAAAVVPGERDLDRRAWLEARHRRPPCRKSPLPRWRCW
jgi:hypothetical protein